ncbi:kinase-like protein [Tilletiaria anomala UBC 951]|uniref:Kinase-like protein n=1 Tax=Tilletiaria anomala (strain ATCC 24038 / CBS 436.72 / UBC 951) TaxID=1037660 RepID=A0A066WG77_TILAU|nr:kinase-like protein [Tilletiaria anomala UBC 951]KDN52972.1 kinase-like protein [Tilletiaria anomala UBC 951]
MPNSAAGSSKGGDSGASSRRSSPILRPVGSNASTGASTPSLSSSPDGKPSHPGASKNAKDAQASGSGSRRSSGASTPPQTRNASSAAVVPGGSGTLLRVGSKRNSAAAVLRNAAHIGSVVDDWPMYSSQPADYILGDVIGFGASSVVYQAAFLPLGSRACAVKVVDLEAFSGDTEVLRRETQLMSLSKHPNVLRVRGCWVDGTKLHIATRLMSSGSMLDIMRFSYPDGFDEAVIATVLKQALEGLNYLHVNGWLHRDLKAGNMLVDEDGTVLLGDFGVGIFLNERADAPASAAGGDAAYTGGATKSFVGTPCWMAPEVVERKHYGHKADIWSFGITALELAHGRAPHSRFAPVKVLMKTLQDEPPQLDRTGGPHRYSKVMEDFVRVCLQKDPSKRPSAEKLLGHAFFKQAKSKKHLVTAILSCLPPLVERQERRRNMSIVSLRNQQSWDFGSGSMIYSTNVPGSSASSSGFLSKRGSQILTMSTAPDTPDPFKNFSASIAAPPVSPGGSMRSKIISIDGEHAIVTPSREAVKFEKLAERFQHPAASAGPLSPSGSRFMASARDHKRSIDSFSRHRKSVSFDGDDGDVGSASGSVPITAAGDSSSLPLLSSPAKAGSLRLRTLGKHGLEAIGEKRSPLILPADAASDNGKGTEGVGAVPHMDLAEQRQQQQSSAADTNESPMLAPLEAAAAADAQDANRPSMGITQVSDQVTLFKDASPKISALAVPLERALSSSLADTQPVQAAQKTQRSASRGAEDGGRRESVLGKLFGKVKK